MALLRATKAGNIEAVRRALAGGVDINRVNEEGGHTALHLASMSGDVDIAKLLLADRRLDVNKGCTDSGGCTALIFAAFGNYVAIVQELLKHSEINISLRDRDGSSALMVAGKLGHLHVVEALLKAEDIAVNQRKNTGATALMLMAENGHADCVRVMLADERVDPCLSIGQGRSNALMSAAYHNRAAVVDMLLEDGRADPNRLDQMGFTALMVAAVSGSVGAVQSLLRDPRTDVSCYHTLPDGVFVSALILAAAGDHPAIVLALIRDERCDRDHATDAKIRAKGCADSEGNHRCTELLTAWQAGEDMQLVCDGCYKCVSEGLMSCSRCGEAKYCSSACQKKAWKQHKKTCRAP